MAKNWLAQLAKYEDSVDRTYNPHNHVIQTGSPSVDFIFGKGYGLPLGLTAAVGGPPKGGKTVVAKMMTGSAHKADPNAIVAKFNTEFREGGQATPEEDQAMFGIDPARFISWETNNPIKIFDRIETDLDALCQDGMPLKLLIIDSITGIQGRRDMNADTLETQQIGDLAKTLQDGLKRILPVIRRHKIALLLTCHIRAEMDQLEQRRGNKVRMALPFGVEHVAEYKIFVQPNRNKEGRTSLSGEEFKNSAWKDSRGKEEQTGHKIFVEMKDSSCGPKGRTGEFTIDYRKGIINVHEEVATLAFNRGVFEKVNNVTYRFDGKDYRGKPAVLEALQNSTELQKKVLTELKRRDQEGLFDAEDVGETEPTEEGDE
jgi:hypothetical protein